MNRKETIPSAIPSWRCDVFRLVVYCGAIAIWLVPLTSMTAVVSSLMAMATGLYAANRAARRHVRIPVVFIIVAALLALGLAADRLIAFEAVSRIVGIEWTIALADAVTFGLLTLAAVLGIRALSHRFAPLAIVELVAVAASTIYLFAGHRDMRFGQPRFLTDWALSRGYHPSDVLLGMGVVTASLAAFLLLPKQRLRHSLATICLLALLAVSGYAALVAWLPHGNLSHAHNASGTDGGNGQGRSSSGNGGGKPAAGGASAPQDMPFDPPPPRPAIPVATIVLKDDYAPVDGVWYFRTSALSECDGRRFVRATDASLDRDIPKGFPNPTLSLPVQQVDSVSTQDVRMTVGLIGQQAKPLALINAIELTAIENPNPKLFTHSYDVTSRVFVSSKRGAAALRRVLVDLAALEAGEQNWDKSTDAHYLQVPSDPRYADLAAQIVKDKVDWEGLKEKYNQSPLLAAIAIRRYLEDNMTYSLKPGHDRHTDPIAEFLFGNRKGYCVHIAHATVALLRSQGVPARVAQGYSVPIENQSARTSVTVLSSDGHAWAEIYLRGVGWVPVDATLQNVDPDTPPFPSPDPETSQFLADQITPQPKVGPDPPPTPTHPVVSSVLPLLLAVLGGVVALLYVIKFWRRLAPMVLPQRTLYRVVYRALLDRLAEVGIARIHGETREEFARRIAEAVPKMQEVTYLHERCASGTAASSRHQWRLLQRVADAQIDETYSRTRRWYGLVRPLCWLKTC